MLKLNVVAEIKSNLGFTALSGNQDIKKNPVLYEALYIKNELFTKLPNIYSNGSKWCDKQGSKLF